MKQPEVTLELAAEHGLHKEEYERILKILGRTPTFTELGIFSVMWSEHWSYKNSIAQLKTLPRSGGRLLVGAGEENAGLVDIGDGDVEDVARLVSLTDPEKHLKDLDLIFKAYLVNYPDFAELYRKLIKKSTENYLRVHRRRENPKIGFPDLDQAIRTRTIKQELGLTPRHVDNVEDRLEIIRKLSKPRLVIYNHEQLSDMINKDETIMKTIGQHVYDYSHNIKSVTKALNSLIDADGKTTGFKNINYSISEENGFRYFDIAHSVLRVAKKLP